MPNYRIYKFDRSGDISGPPEVISPDTDDEAILMTKQLLDGQDLELWEGPRLLIRLESPDKK